MDFFSSQVLKYYKNLKPSWKLPEGIELIFPFSNDGVFDIMNQFYTKYYHDTDKRCMLFGINPGRLGAGMTGVPFTDPIRLENKCRITNSIKKRQELSSVFIYDMISKFKSVEDFYSKIYITSICPLGFTKDGKNYNYYDSKVLYESVEKEIVKAIQEQLKFNCRSDKAFSLGKGKNFKVLQKLNAKYNWFDEVVPLPHPRWVMQYKLKTKELYLDEYVNKLSYLFT